MKGLGAGGRLWELLERKPELPFNGGSAARWFFLVGSTGVLPVLPEGGVYGGGQQRGGREEEGRREGPGMALEARG